MKLKDRFAAFMYGRNGNDEFYTFLMWVALALLIVAWIFMIAGLHVVYIILYALDLLMIAKYFERIGDHATNIAEWVEFSVTGEHKELHD